MLTIKESIERMKILKSIKAKQYDEKYRKQINFFTVKNRLRSGYTSKRQHQYYELYLVLDHFSYKHFGISFDKLSREEMLKAHSIIAPLKHEHEIQKGSLDVVKQMYMERMREESEQEDVLRSATKLNKKQSLFDLVERTMGWNTK